MRTNSQIFEVGPARLDHGAWCHRAEKTLGEGDIAASYSADRIGENKPVRKPFNWQGSLWITTSGASRHGVNCFEAYRLVHPSVFSGEATTYREKVRIDGGEFAREDVNGFYHGMAVKHAGETLILCGPPAKFVAGQTQQLSLFAPG
jgi:hypothetical protein